MTTLWERIKSDFTYHQPNGDQVVAMQSIRGHCLNLAAVLSTTVPEGRELSLCLTYLEQVSMWANAGIARHGAA